MLLATGALAATFPALAQDGGLRDDVGRASRFSKLVPAEQVEASAAQQYLQLQREAASKRALAAPSNPQLIRLRSIAERIIPFTPAWNSRAAQWKWEVNLLMSPTINAGHDTPICLNAPNSPNDTN